MTLIFLLPVLVLAVGLLIAHKVVKPHERHTDRLTPDDDRYYRELHTVLRMSTAIARSQMHNR